MASHHQRWYVGSRAVVEGPRECPDGEGGIGGVKERVVTSDPCVPWYPKHTYIFPLFIAKSFRTLALLLNHHPKMLSHCYRKTIQKLIYIKLCPIPEITVIFIHFALFAVSNTGET